MNGQSLAKKPLPIIVSADARALVERELGSICVTADSGKIVRNEKDAKSQKLGCLCSGSDSVVKETLL